MRWTLDENRGDILYETIGDQLVLKVRPEVLASAGGGQGEGDFPHIKLNDATTPSDSNAFTALRTLKEIKDAAKDWIIEADEMFLRKDVDDTAHGNILFDQRIGSSVFLEGMEGKGWEIKQSGSALLDSVMIRKNAIIGGHAGSEIFVSGFPSGLGWDLGPYKRFNAADVEETKYRLELDDLIVRGKLRVFEMIISQLRGENDNVIFAGQMKVAFYDAPSGRLYLDTDKGILYNPFRPGDILMVQRFGGLPSAGNNYNVIKQYELRVNEAGVGSLSDGESRLDWITFTNFVGELSDIAVGDVLTRVDSVSDSTRKGIVKVTTIDEIGAPYIDVVYGMKTDPLHSTKVRMGNLSGIRTKNQMDLTGVWGLYAEGAVLENSTFYLDNGMTVEQQFTVMNGELNSKIEGVKNDMSLEQGNILRNSSFSSDTNYWQASNDVHFINVGGSFLWLDGSFYVEKRAVADIYRDGSKNVLRILNTGIRQPNEVMNGDKIAGTYSFSFFYKVLRTGTLSVGIEGTELYLNQSLGESSSYQKMLKAGTWDGTGDFKLQFTGEILIYGISLFNDALADATIKLQTQIQQNAERISLTATKEYVDSETGSIYQKYDSELKVQADEISQRVTKTEYETGTNTIKREWESKFSVQADRISAISTKVNNIDHTISTAGWITTADSVNIFAQELNKTGIKNSLANLQVKYNEISSIVSDNEQNITNVRNLANSAANQAQKAMGSGIYGQEQYSQSNNPWNSWQSGTEYKHVGALWYNTSTGETKRYTGTDGSNSWETVSNGAISAASYVLQNKDKWSLVVANFDSNGNPTNASGIVTTAYGNTLWASKNGIISAINQSSETISIDASKINLNGVVTANRTFIIEKNGTFKATGGNIGNFEIKNNRLVWEGRDYFGDTSRTIKLGYGSNNDGLVDVAFGISTQGRFGVKAVGRAPGSAAIYGSSQSSPSYPTSPTVWAGWFDGYVNTKGYFINGKGGVNWNQTVGSPDLDQIRLIVEGGIIIGYYRE